ncbi:MAG: winged helix-turn-helix domain-containing protein [Pyrinomonadaceae bacterium]
MNKSLLYEFEGFRVDTEQRLVTRADEQIPLTPKAFETLVVLLKHKGRAVSKENLLDEVWKDSFVEEATLAQNISTIRRAFAKYGSADEIIVTVPRFGYKFAAAVTETTADEEVLVVEKRSVTHIVSERTEIKEKNWLGSWRALAIAFGGLIAIIGLGAISYLFWPGGKGDQFETKFGNFQMATLFSGENIGQSALSPDGKYVAVVEKKDEGDQLILRQLGEGNPVSLVADQDLHVSGVAFSPKSDSVYYSAYKKSEPYPKYGNLYSVPLLGGAPRLIAKDVDGPVSFSPDYKRVAFVRGVIEPVESVLITADLDGKNEKVVAKRDLRSGFSTSGLSWSPDGKHIAATVIDKKDRERPMKVVVVDAQSGEQQYLSGENWTWVGQALWLPDGSGIVVVAYASKSANLTDEIWFVSYPEGKARVVTRGLSGITGFGIRNDAGLIVAGKTNRIVTRLMFDLDGSETTETVSKSVNEESVLTLGAGWMPDGRLIYGTTQNGNADIWTMTSDGTGQSQLSSDPSADFDPVLSADGKHIYFRSNRSGKMSIWRMESDGTDSVEIVSGLYPSRAAPSPDGKYLYYSLQPEGKNHSVLFRSQPDGKLPEALTDFRAFVPVVSPDGKFLLCQGVEGGKPGEDVTAKMLLTLYSIEERKIVKQFEEFDGNHLPLIQWKPDGSGFYFVSTANGGKSIVERGLDGAEKRTVRKFDDGHIFQIALSPDGKRMFVEKGEDVVSVLKLTSG